MKRPVRSLVVIGSLLMLLLPTAGSAQGIGPGRLYREQLQIGRSLVEAQSTNWTSLLQYYADDIEYHDPIVDIYGIDTMAEFLGRLFASSPDLVTTIEDDTLLNGVYTATWTMAGQFSGVPYSAKGISIIKFRDRSTMVYYQRDYYSENDIMINIPGLDEAAIGFRTYYRCAVDPTFDCPFPAASIDALEEINPDEDLLPPSGDESRDRGPFWLRRQRMEIGRALVEINASDWQSLLAYYTEDYEYHDPIVDVYGRATMVELLARLFASSPDLVTTVEDESLVGGMYTATWTMAGEFDGASFSAKGMSIVKFLPGRVRAYYSRDYYTEGDIMASIPGLDEAIGAFRTYYRCAVDPTFDCPQGAMVALTNSEGDNGRSEGLHTDAFRLHQNFPNPFNPVTQISFQVPEGGASVALRIYDVSGRLIRTLSDSYEPAGIRTFNWDGTDDAGQPVASGTYFYQVAAPSFSETKKMLLLK